MIIKRKRQQNTVKMSDNEKFVNVIQIPPRERWKPWRGNEGVLCVKLQRKYSLLCGCLWRGCVCGADLVSLWWVQLRDAAQKGLQQDREKRQPVLQLPGDCFCVYWRSLLSLHLLLKLSWPTLFSRGTQTPSSSVSDMHLSNLSAPSFSQTWNLLLLSAQTPQHTHCCIHKAYFCYTTTAAALFSPLWRTCTHSHAQLSTEHFVFPMVPTSEFYRNVGSPTGSLVAVGFFLPSEFIRE